MDIGDPSEIPATRRKLPSMQELGAFDFGAPAQTSASGNPERPATTPPGGKDADLGEQATAPGAVTNPPPAAPPAVTPTKPAAAAAKSADASAASAMAAASAASPAPAARPALTAEQLRQALAKADPGTRQKLLRLIAGGRTVQQVAGAAPAEGSKRRSLVMKLESPPQSSPPPVPVPAAAPAPAPKPTPTPSPSTASAPPPAAFASAAWGGASSSGFGAFNPARASASAQAAGATAARAHPAANRSVGRSTNRIDQALMQIDEHTELLDAAPAPTSPAARKAELQAQLDQVPREAAAAETPRTEPLAHKVLFPAYDPTRHGEDVHGHTRRRHEGPIEGHYPAPRQPFEPRYKHPDGRPMNAEESQVEEVLQTQRCEETLGVLARDGVNGLLLSPRDLDAAVANGVISAEAAATLWKTWAALRPVIHVIEDDPPKVAPAPDDLLADTPEAARESMPDDMPQETLAAAPTEAPHELPQKVVPHPLALAAVPAAAPAITPTPPLAAGPLDQDGEDRQPEPVTLPLPYLGQQAVPRPWSADVASPAHARTAAQPAPALTPFTSAAAAASDFAPAPAPTKSFASRVRSLVKAATWLFIAYCVLVTSSRLAMVAWVRWGHWISG